MFRSLIPFPPKYNCQDFICRGIWLGSLNNFDCLTTRARGAFVRLFISGVVTLLMAQPGYCGSWKVTLEVQGKSKSQTDENEHWSAFGTNKTRAWQVKADSGSSGGASFTTSAGATLYASGLPGGLGAKSDVECTGSITPVFTWVPRTNLHDDPPSSVIQYKEVGYAEASRGRTPQYFPTYSNTFSMNMDHGEPASDAAGDSRSLTSEMHITLRNDKGANIVHGKTRSFSVTGKGETPANSVAGLEQACAVSYDLTLSKVSGSATLMLYREDEQTGQLYSLYSPDSSPESKPTVGDWVWVGLEFGVGSHAKLDPELRSVKVRLKENEDPKLGTDQHTNEDNHIDLTFPLVPGNGGEGGFRWQKRVGTPNGDDGWEDTMEAFSTSSGEQHVEYRVLWPWDSRKSCTMEGTKLWDHNGDHVASVVAINGKAVAGPDAQRIEFLPDENSDQASCPIGQFPQRLVSVKNLIISSVSTSTGTSDYFKFDSVNTKLGFSSPVINFTIKDEGLSHVYEWRVRVRSTDKESYSDSVVYAGSVGNPGPIAVHVDQQQTAEDSPDTQLRDAGTYNFEISVKEIKNGRPVDYADYRSRVFIPYKMPGQSPEKFGHDGKIVEGSDETKRWYLYYYFQDTNKLYEGKRKNSLFNANIAVLDPSFQKILDKSSGSNSNLIEKTVNAPHLGENGDGILIYEFLDPNSDAEIHQAMTGNPYISILTGKDDYALFYRDHEKRSILAKNSRKFSFR